jgi:hypothetical protein
MIFVRPTRPEDSEKFTEWYSKHPSFDPDVIRFPETYTLCAYRAPRCKDGNGKIIGFMPVQSLSFVSSQVLDSLIINPEATNLEIAEAMRELVKQAIFLGHLKGCGMVYFVGDHPETNKIAEKIFEKVEYPVYRLRLKDLEG